MTQRHDQSWAERSARDRGKGWAAAGCLLLIALFIAALVLATR